MSSYRSTPTLAISTACLLAFWGSAYAFPPAPPTTIHGMVRGEFGYALDDGSADLVLLADGVEIVRAPIKDTGFLYENCRFTLPVDLNPLQGVYRNDAVSGDLDAEYVIVVERNGRRIPVVEVNTAVDTFMPKAAGLVRVEFILGNDADGDGLPDAWERFQVGSGDYDGEDPLTALSREGDFDGDGLSDWNEYLAGTFAVLFEDSLSFRIVNVSDDGRTSFEFFGVNGKTYTLEASDDASTWERVPFEMDTEAASQRSSFKAETTEMNRLHLTHELPIPRKFYRLRAN